MPRSRATAPPTLICFVRHGTTPTTGKVLPGRARGLHLAEQGRAEAEATAARLAALDRPIVLYSSPLERARETAAPIARALASRVAVERGLLECDFGEWTGRELAALRKLPEWQAVLQHPSTFRFPGGESFAELEARVAATVERLVARHPGEVVVAVSHADPIKVAIGQALGAPLDLIQRIHVSPASVSAVAYGSGAPVVLAQNTTSELAEIGLARPRRRS